MHVQTSGNITTVGHCLSGSTSRGYGVGVGVGASFLSIDGIELVHPTHSSSLLERVPEEGENKRGKDEEDQLSTLHGDPTVAVFPRTGPRGVE